MKVILPNKHVIEGYLKPFTLSPYANLKCKPKKQLNTTCRQKET